MPLPEILLPHAPVVLGTAAALVGAFLATAFVRRSARAGGFVDEAESLDGAVRRVPLGGGIAVLAALGAGAALAFRSGIPPTALRVILLTLAMGLVGLRDDARPMRPAVKLLLQTIVVSSAYAALRDDGFRITVLPGGEPVACATTILWVLAVTNAMNLFDHEDGSSAGVGSIAAAMLSATAFQTGQGMEGTLLAILSGALAGFLPHNFPPARIFLGDAGSLSVGFLLGTLTVMQTFWAPETTPWRFAAPLLCLAVPLFDSALVVAIRLRERAPVFRGDRNHFTHRLIALGMTRREAVLSLYGLAFCLSVGAPILYALPPYVAQVALLQAIGVLCLTALLERAGRRR
ncbi:MAG: undecaprenyl/decaprenyl-phosphate alpha-N-acetylglucosaminyl 1-phosphate transferase [Planctomycetes bacterium]|nr:undecaprenyl/decaprenyl-phosphate alpha-N-acetylglucosaminyl 1-phosphate transferase [Planctomycetota bacterium]